ncbi:hypothetical protein CSA80_02630 [Candidatus Saccharibacteria bacterium]|nr:MAG: hypothetical protein CR973_02745 [Candidatus Saccharibacteria bacterium]PID98992.1 MAG: hypothetical protein CSA80_02630 [Candidatus Saccharibacteria bacterium]
MIRWQPLLPGWIVIVMAVGALILLGWWLFMIRSRRHPRPSNWFVTGRAIAIGALMLLAAAGPSLPGDRSPAGMLNLDVIFLVDRTASMSALDYDGDQQRLDGVRQDLDALIDALNGARMTIVTFGSEVNTVMPFTDDATSARQAAAVIDQEIALYASGSSIDKPIELATKLLEKSKEKNPTRGRLVFYFGDGEQSASNSPASFAPLASLIDGGAVLGYGTAAGAKMPTYYGPSLYGNSTSTDSYVYDYTSNEPAISRYDEANLTKIADDMGVPYQHRQSSSQSIDDLVDDSRAERVASSHREILHYLNLYWFITILVAGLLGWWLWDMAPTLYETLRRKELP